MLVLPHILSLLHGSLAFRDPTGDVPIACGPCPIYQVRAMGPEELQGPVPGSLQPSPGPSGAALVPLPVGGWSYLS